MTRRPPFPANVTPPGSSAPYPGSQDDLAARFVAQHGASWKYVPARKTWHYWTGSQWRGEETGLVLDVIRLVCREAAGLFDTPAEKRRISSLATFGAVERIAAMDRRLAAQPSDFDVDPFLLNTPGGIVDLRTGKVRAQDPDAMLSRMTRASPGSGCPRWCAFVDELTDGDRELAGYLQRLAGYCLTGSTKEQAFVFLHGPGENGKSVFLLTLAQVLGDYAATAAQATFMAARHDRHPTELAGFVGRRLVSAAETEEGRIWAESLIKTITGGEAMRVRFMHRDEFEYTPGFKLIFTGNHRPRIRGVGRAMRRRLQLVPLLRALPPGARDGNMRDRLLEERDGILGWMLEGCMEWQRIGLAPPPAVTDAVDRYFRDEDIVGQWIEACCVTGPDCQAGARDLFTSWSRWAGVAGYERGSQKSLGVALGESGFAQKKVKGARGWNGIALKAGGGA